MSRSYKHTPYCGDKKNKFFKTYFNRKLRRRKLYHNLQHKSYRKNSCSYDICDYYEIETKNFEEYYRSYIARWHGYQNYYWRKNDPLPTREELWKRYKKYYLSK